MKKRGRPPRTRQSTKESERWLLIQDRAIAHHVYEAVFQGLPYRDDALIAGQKAAARYGRKVSLDGVEAIIERLLKRRDFVYTRTPGQELRFRSELHPNQAYKNGLRTLIAEPFVPDGDSVPNHPILILRRTP